MVYLPYGGFSHCEELISEYSSRYKSTVLMGDFNIDLFENNVNMGNACERIGLKISHNSLPTHFTIGSDRTKLLDYFLVSDLNLTVKSDQFHFPALNSHHALIFLLIKIEVKVIPQITIVRAYNVLNYEAFENDLNNIDLIKIYNDPNIGNQAKFLSQMISPKQIWKNIRNQWK